MNRFAVRIARSISRRLPGFVSRPLRGALARWQLTRQVSLVVRSGAFDQEWYEAQTGTRFVSQEQACRDYLASGRRLGMSPHPLFEPQHVDRVTWATAKTDPLVRNLRGNTPKGECVHPLVPRSFTRAGGKVTGRPQWVAWASQATADTLMPTTDGALHSGPVTWGAFRAESLRVVREIRRQHESAAVARVSSHRPELTSQDIEVQQPADADTPLVSIITPTWNRAALLRRAIASVQAQSLSSWEMIVVDDGSTDDTLLMVEGQQRLDGRIRVIAAEHGGVCRARNLGLKSARGQFVAFLDSDNTWEPDFLLQVVGHMQMNAWSLAHAVLEIPTVTGALYRALEGNFDDLLVASYIDLNVLVVAADLLVEVGGFDESLRRAVDYDLILRLAKVASPHLVPYVGARYTDDREDHARISVAEPLSWNSVVRARHLLDGVEVGGRVKGRLSVVLPIRRRMDQAVPLIRELLGSFADVEVICVVAGAGRAFARMLSQVALGDSRVKVMLWPTDLELAVSTNLGARAASGEFLALWRPNCMPHQAWATRLLEVLADGHAVAQPLMLQVDGTIASAGAVFTGRDPAPSPFLVGLPEEDAAGLGTLEIPAAYGGVMMVRAETFWAAGGLNPLHGNGLSEVDLTMRLRQEGLGSTALAPQARVTSRAQRRFAFVPDTAASVRVLRDQFSCAPSGSDLLWAAAGFEVVGRTSRTVPAGRGTAPQQLAAPLIRPVMRASVFEAAPSLRWAIDIAAPAGPRGLKWGDWHFAQSLASALRRLGQTVHVDRREARVGGHRELDDVVLVLRGLDLVVPRPAQLSILWIISHPELITKREVETFDAVFAASARWASDVNASWGTRVEPLLQCTDSRVFTPHVGQPDSGHELLFVGNSRKVLRPAVGLSVEAGLEPAVFGGGWEGLIDDRFIHGEYVDNAQLPALYRSAGVVLNDHWDDMRVDGFISNRVFDVLASAGRLMTDEVAGLRDLFDGQVRTFASRWDLAAQLGGDWRSSYPGDEDRLRLAELVRSEHSFDSRARRLLDTAVSLVAAQGSAG